MRHVHRQINALRSFEPLVIAQKRANASHFPQRNLHLVPRSALRFTGRFRERHWDGRPWQMSSTEARRILEIMDSRGARLLHVFFGNVAVHLLPLLRLCPVPVVVSFHGADVTGSVTERAFRPALEEVFSTAAKVFVRSRHLAGRVEELGCDPARIRLTRTLLPELPFFERSAPEDGAWRVVQACRLLPKKGAMTTLRAFAEVAEEFPLARLVFAGDGPMEATLRKEAARLGLAAQVEFTGFLDMASLLELLRAAHVFMHPSETAPDGDVEGVPNALLEAMATGLPAVAARHGGIPEVLREGPGVFLIPERKAGAAARALREIFTSPEIHGTRSKAAADAVRAVFSVESGLGELEEAYREAMAPGE